MINKSITRVIDAMEANLSGDLYTKTLQKNTIYPLNKKELKIGTKFWFNKIKILAL